MAFVRGSIITFSATCVDKDGAAVEPDAATLYLVYTTPDGESTSTEIAMTVNGATVSAEWDSSVAKGGANEPVAATEAVSWCIKTTGADKTAAQGVVPLLANAANPSS